eukprot:gene3961-4321_t
MFILTDDDDGDLVELSGNVQLRRFFEYVARDFDHLEPKAPNDVYFRKGDRDKQGTQPKSYQANLASTLVNAFVNAAYQSDTLLLDPSQEGGINSSWLFMNKEHRETTAAASVGMLYLWDISVGANVVDPLLYSASNNTVAGAVMAIGILSSGLKDACDTPLALIGDKMDSSNSKEIRTSALLGIGLAYAGHARSDIQEMLVPLVSASESVEIASFAALALGLVFVGSGDADISDTITTYMMDNQDAANLSNTLCRYLPLGLGLLYLGKREKAEACAVACAALAPSIAKYAQATIRTCAYAGTGNVEKVQELLQEIREKQDKDKDDKDKDKDKDDGISHQAVDVLGLAIVGFGEEYGSNMCKRMLQHVLTHGNTASRQAVPLALALMDIGVTALTVVDSLVKLSHDANQRTALNAIIALGLVGAGTCNARVSNLLRGLATFYQREPQYLFTVRVSQGLVHMGKGLLTLSPLHSDSQVLCPVALAHLLVFMHSCLDAPGILLNVHHFMYYVLVGAMSPRFVVAVDSDLEPVEAEVKVGNRIDVVAQPGNPKTISGVQQLKTPIILQQAQRAVFADEKYLVDVPHVEGILVTEPNPGYKAEES